MDQVPIETDTESWEQALLKVHPREVLDRVEQVSSQLEPGQTSYITDEDNYENMHTFAAAKLSSQACLTAVKTVLN